MEYRLNGNNSSGGAVVLGLLEAMCCCACLVLFIKFVNGQYYTVS